MFAVLAACANPQAEPQKAPVEDRALQLELPLRYEHWRPQLEQEWRGLKARFDTVAARWPRQEQAAMELRLAIPANAQTARIFYSAAQLQGVPEVPRTFPALGLAVVPLPQDDALLAALPAPPRTWLHGFRHECAHLLSLDRPALRAAPRWFQEGFAELWCAEDAGAGGQLQPLPDVWPRWGSYARYWPHPQQGQAAGDDPTMPAEVAYSAYAARVAQSLMDGEDPEPWLQAPRMVPGATTEPQAFHGLRGRHADWNGQHTRFLIASQPGKQVDLDLPLELDRGDSHTFELQLGRTSLQPEAGLVLFDSTTQDRRIRIRFGRGGGLAVYPERGARSHYQAFESLNDRNRPGRPRVLELRLDGESLHVFSEDYRRTLSLDELGLRPPLQLRMVVVDGVFRLQSR
ncbi:MAG: hypothetical protein ACPG31_09530 [Planctomycetota bacterium]